MTKVVVKNAANVVVLETKEDATFSDARSAHKMFMDAAEGVLQGRVSVEDAHTVARLGEVAIAALDMQLKIARQSRDTKSKIIEGEATEVD